MKVILSVEEFKALRAVANSERAYMSNEAFVEQFGQEMLSILSRPVIQREIPENRVSPRLFPFDFEYDSDEHEYIAELGSHDEEG